MHSRQICYSANIDYILHCRHASLNTLSLKKKIEVFFQYIDLFAKDAYILQKVNLNVHLC